MTAWRALIQDLAATGKPAAFRREFDRLPSPRDFVPASQRARELGFLVRAESGRWVLTRLGLDYLSGRCTVVGRGRAGKGRVPSVVRATWLASLPRPEQIKGQA